MLLTLIKKELLRNILSLKVLVCYCALVVLVVFSTMYEGFAFRRATDVYNRNMETYTKERKEASSFAESNWYNHQIAPVRLSIFVKGFADELSRPFLVQNAHPTDVGRIIRTDPVDMVYRVYDTGLIVCLVVSLLALFVGYDTVSGEAERGTLRLMLAGPVGRGTVILGKLAGGMLTMIIPLALAYLVSLVLLYAVVGISFTGGELLRIGLHLALSGVYLLIFLLIATIFSVITRSSAVALLGSVTVWIFLVMVLANPALFVEGLMGSVPSEVDLQREKTVMMAETHKKTVAAQDAWVKSGKPVILLWTKNWYNSLAGWGVILKQQFYKIRGKMESSIAIARLNPANAYRFAGAAISGTGFTDLFHFEAWKMNLIEANSQMVYKEEDRRRSRYPDLEYRAQSAVIFKEPIAPELFPSCVYTAPGAADRVRSSLPDAAVLLGFLTILFGMAVILFNRQEMT